MKRKTFLRGAATLGISGAAVKGLGALYRVPIIAAIGCYGLGLYQAVYAFFAFIVTLCSSGISAAVSKQIAEARAKGQSGENVLRNYLRLFLTVGFLGSAVVAVFPLIFHGARGEKPSLGYYFLAPAVPLACISAIIGGAFQGAENMLPTAVSETVGQGAKILIGIALCFMAKANARGAAALLCLAVTFSLLFETGTLFFFAKKYRGSGGNSGNFTNISLTGSEIFRERLCVADGAKIFAFTLPLTLSVAVLPLTAFAESLLLPALLSEYASNAFALYGLFAGGAACIAHLPVTLCRGVGAAVIPDLSAEIKKSGIAQARKKISYACLLTFAVAAFAAAVLFVCSPIAVKILFRSLSAEEKRLLVSCVRIALFGAVFLSLSQTLSAALTAQEKPRGAAACWGVACLSKIFFDLVFVGVGKFSVKGAAAAESLCYFVAFLLIFVYNRTCLKRATVQS